MSGFECRQITNMNSPSNTAPHGWIGALILATGLAACGGGAAAPDPTPTPTPVALPAVNVGSVAAADPGSTLAEGWEHGGVMEIFVRSYQDSNGDGHRRPARPDQRGSTTCRRPRHQGPVADAGGAPARTATTVTR